MKTQDININLIGKKVRGIFTGMEITGTIIDIVSLWSSKMSGTETYGEDVPADPEMHLCSKGVVIALDTPVRWGDYFYTKYESTARICDDWGNLSHTELI